jgi:ribosomal protein S18 acetylase RimI-like enzyme
MNLQEQILRIKSLMSEDTKDYRIITEGDIFSPTGVKIMITKPDYEYIGETSAIIYEQAMSGSEKLREIMSDVNSPFTNDNCVYEFSLDIKEDYRGQGWGNKIKKETLDLIKNSGIPYIIGIVKKNNQVSQNLHKKHGYETHHSTEFDDLMYKKLL